MTATGAESKFWVASRAVVDQDGRARGGRLQEREGTDNYLAELAAQIDALSSCEGERVFILFDATSPVKVVRSFAGESGRARQEHYAATWV